MSGDYISREAAIKEVYRFDGYLDDDLEWRLHYALKKLPAADVVEARHGRWIYAGTRGSFPACKCSVCGNVENADWAVLGDNVNYCPSCGAMMDGGQDA